MNSNFVVTPATAGMIANDNRKDDCGNSKDDDCKSKTTPTGSPPVAETLATDGTKVGTLAIAETLATTGGASNARDTKNSKDDE